MKNTVPLIFLSFATQLIIIVHAQNGTLIDETCKLTLDHDLCVTTLYKDPQIASAKTVTDLARILVISTGHKGLDTYNHIEVILNNASTDPRVKQLLKDNCEDRYTNIINVWVTGTLKGLSQQDYSFARDQFASIPTNVELCERSFEAPKLLSPITSDSQAMDALAKNAYAVVYYKYMHPYPPLVQ